MTTTENATTPSLWPAPTATGSVDAVVPVPGSKSASNRALVLAAIADGPSTITGLLDARDTQLMMAGLRLLGNEVHVTDHDAVGNLTATVTPHFMRGPVSIDVGLAGTVMRFLPPAACLAHGEITFDGDAHSRRRPMATVIESLKDLGVTIHDRGTGRLPFMIEATGEVTRRRGVRQRVEVEPVHLRPADQRGQVQRRRHHPPRRRPGPQHAAHPDDHRDARGAGRARAVRR